MLHTKELTTISDELWDERIPGSAKTGMRIPINPGQSPRHLSTCAWKQWGYLLHRPIHLPSWRRNLAAIQAMLFLCIHTPSEYDVDLLLEWEVHILI